MTTTGQCCTAQSSFTVFTRSLSLGLFVERAQDTSRSASNSCQSRRNACTFAWAVDRQPLDVQEVDKTCLRCQRLVFRIAQTCRPHRAVPRHSAKHVISTHVRHSPQTQTPQTQTTQLSSRTLSPVSSKVSRSPVLFLTVPQTVVTQW